MRISCIKLLFFVISSVKSEMKSMQFQRVSSFDGKECQGTEIAFSRENVSRRIMCLIECSKYENCQSFFHAQSTGRCTGCTKIYGTYTNPTGTASGTTYYSQTGKVLNTRAKGTSAQVIWKYLEFKNAFRLSINSPRCQIFQGSFS